MDSPMSANEKNRIPDMMSKITKYSKGRKPYPKSLRIIERTPTRIPAAIEKSPTVPKYRSGFLINDSWNFTAKRSKKPTTMRDFC